MKAGVVVFPGSNCDRDMKVALQSLGFNVTMLWHKDTVLPKLDLIVFPGGFSYGDYLRCGAMAAHSNLVKEIKKFAEAGGYVLGVCNGFQILTEAQLLPGVLMRNKNLKFICKDVYLKPENVATAFTKKFKDKKTAKVSIAHADGNYFVQEDELKALNDNAQIAFKYADASGELTDLANPNGSIASIAGVFNKKKNILGMMPHPERHCEATTGGVDGRLVFESLLG
jgi:phosphoribosylformylglycinamidine synthase subunit PurQ / glutaminase